VTDTERTRIVVTGLGAVTPLGIGVDATWSKLLAGENAVGPTRIFDAETFPTRISAECDLAAVETALEAEGLRMPHAGRNAKFAMLAGLEAWRDAGLEGAPIDADRTGVYLGSGEGIMNFDTFANSLLDSLDDDTEVDIGAFMQHNLDRLHPIAELEQEPHLPAGHLANLFGASGPNFNTLTACAASSQAIGEAAEIVRRGDADIMIGGGCHSMIHPFGMTGFICLTALSTRNDDPAHASRPFDATRDGFILGEGSAMVILERRDHALARGAHIYGELLGYGASADAFRVTDQHPEGRGGLQCINRALSDARLDSDAIDYISAHGTSTKVNDRVETLAIKIAFGDRAYKVPVSSIKSMFGHLIAAAGAMEFIACLLAIRDGRIPPTINYEHPDPDCDLDYVPGEARDHAVGVALSNSFGFGGQNVALVVSAPDYRK
jgi:3-oxoacyl-[acyl-carrier-protein] synthase II